MVSKQGHSAGKRSIASRRASSSRSTKHLLCKRTDKSNSWHRATNNVVTPRRDCPTNPLPMSPNDAACVLGKRFAETGLIQKILGFQRQLLWHDSIRQVCSLARRAAEAWSKASATGGDERDIRQLVSCIRRMVQVVKRYPSCAVLPETALQCFRMLLFDSRARSPTHAVYPLRASGIIPVIVQAMQRHGARGRIVSAGLEILLVLCSNSDLEDVAKCRTAVQEMDRAGGLDLAVAALACLENRRVALALLKATVSCNSSMLERLRAHLVRVVEEVSSTDDIGNCPIGKGSSCTAMDENFKVMLSRFQDEVETRLYWHDYLSEQQQADSGSL